MHPISAPAVSAVLLAVSVDENWDGSPLTLQAGQSASLPFTPNGSVVFAAENLATMNNAGALLLTSGSTGVPLNNIPSLSRTPVLLVNNWKAANLQVTNTSPAPQTPIRIQLVGPGMPGIKPLTLPTDGTMLSLPPGATAQAWMLPRWMQFVMTQDSGDMTTIAVIGGPEDSSGNNAFVFGLASPYGNTGPGTGINPPAPYYQTVPGNVANYQLNWGSALLFCANLSGETAAPARVTVRSL